MVPERYGIDVGEQYSAECMTHFMLQATEYVVVKIKEPNYLHSSV